MVSKDSLVHHGWSYSSKNSEMDVLTIVYSSGALACILLVMTVIIYTWKAHPITKKKEEEEKCKKGQLVEEGALKSLLNAPATEKKEEKTKEPVSQKGSVKDTLEYKEPTSQKTQKSTTEPASQLKTAVSKRSDRSQKSSEKSPDETSDKTGAKSTEASEKSEKKTLPADQKKD